MTATATESNLRRLGIVGTGRIGEAILSGLLRSGWITPDQVMCTDRDPRRTAFIAETHGVAVSTDNTTALVDCDVILVAVKPQAIGELLDEIGSVLGIHQTVISVAAGITTERFERAFTADVPVVRVMTNTPVLIDEAMSVAAGGSHADDAHVDLAMEILSHVGQVIRMREEHLDAVTALSGSGPAYFFLLAEAMIDAGILLGLPRDVSTQLIVQTMVGSALMLRDSGVHPVELREQVTSPGGTTIAAIRKLESAGVRAAFLDAIEAARDRSVELAGD